MNEINQSPRRAECCVLLGGTGRSSAAHEINGHTLAGFAASTTSLTARRLANANDGTSDRKPALLLPPWQVAARGHPEFNWLCGSGATALYRLEPK
ncbi:hypothetical protein [Duganella caerulea]|uniref:hypothetical protein n=1 Tax=Duganella caerulea TaxID=2885762 RepID=UPI0040384CF3